MILKRCKVCGGEARAYFGGDYVGLTLKTESGLDTDGHPSVAHALPRDPLCSEHFARELEEILREIEKPWGSTAPGDAHIPLRAIYIGGHL